MNFTCDNCNRRYTVPDEKVRGRTVKTKCKNCQHLIVLHGETLEEGRETAPVSAAPTPPSSAEWFVMVQGQQVGPESVQALASRVNAGEVTARSYFWKKGMADWKRGEELPELRTLVGAKAPLTAAPRAPEPVRTVCAAAAPAAGELFSDVDKASAPVIERPLEKRADPDPFAALGDIDPAKLPPPGEATRFFIAQAGVNKRNPPWKIALFIGAWLGVPALLVYVLSTLNVVPLQVVRIDEQGQEVAESVFSQGIVSGIGDLLSGKTLQAKREVEKVKQAARKHAVATPAGDPAPQPPNGATQPTTDTAAPAGVDLEAFYAAKADKGPVVRKDVEVKQKDGQAGGPEQEAVSKVVAATQPAFQFCVEQELRKNPKFRGGKVMLTATIGTSGVVKSAFIDRRDIDNSELGECIKGKAKRMMFGTFSGDEVQVEFPLILTSSM